MREKISLYKKLLILSLSLLFLFSYRAQAQGKLEIIYLQRLPFSGEINNEKKGILIDLSKKIISKAKISADYKAITTWMDATIYLKKKVNSCFLGSYKTEKRATLYQFSQAIYQEKPFIVVANAALKASFKDEVLVEDLFNSQFVMGFQEGFSYGDVIDLKMRSSTNPQINLAYLTNKQGKNFAIRNIFTLIDKGRVDYYFMNPTEFDWNLKYGGQNSNLAKINLKPSPEGNHRYYMCSKGVSDKTIKRINKAIKDVKESNDYQQIIESYDKS